MRRQNPESGLLVFWVKLVSVDIAAQLPYIETHRESSDEPPNSKYVPNPYEQMLYPGQATPKTTIDKYWLTIIKVEENSFTTFAF